MRFWSPSKLRNGVKNWKEITPQPLHMAVEALRRKFADNAWKADKIMRRGCHPALHRGMADQAGSISDGIKKLGYPALPNVDQGHAEPAVFTAYFNRCANLLALEVRGTFSDLFDIGSAQSALLSSDPVDWASLQTKVLVADESHRISLWTKDACDKQPYPSADPDEMTHWRKWRAPKWFFMQPFASSPYDRATAWGRMDEAESKELLEVVEDRFNQRLIMALEKAVDETHVRLAKQGSQGIPTASGVAVKSATEVPVESVSKGGHMNGPRSNADQWRDFRDKFQALADEERREGTAQRDQCLRAYCNYNEHPEVWERGKPGQGLFCLLKTPPCGVWDLDDGVSENFQASFRALSARSGLALGCPKDTDAEDFWLHRLYLDLLENNSDQLFAASKEGGVILRVCVASATFCSRLERKALETSVSVNPRDGRRRKSERGDPEVAKRRSLVRSNPNTPADELCSIFDREGVPLPFKWQDSGLEEWTKAYKKPEYRRRIDVLVSKDRLSD